jgi:hypothetical protein
MGNSMHDRLAVVTGHKALVVLSCGSVATNENHLTSMKDIVAECV